MSTRRSTELDNMRRTRVAENILSVQEQSVRQQEQIARMIEENDQIKKEIGSVSGTHYDYVKADKVASLQSDVDGLERRYQFEKLRKNDLTKRYQLARIDLLHSRKLRGGVNVEKEQAVAVQRQVEILESRLDQTLGQFNDSLSYNKELRDRIDVIREERRVFLRVHKRMEDDLKAKKRLMADHIEKSNRDMDDRDAQLREVERLRAALTDQRHAYSEQLRNMDIAMMDIKNMRERQTEMQLELEAREYEFNERMNDITLTRSQDDSDLSRRTIGASMSGNAEEGALIGDDGCDDAESMLHVDKESTAITSILVQIKEALGTDDLDDVRSKYLRAGDLNFSMYKYINELSAKKELLKDSIRDLQRLIGEEDDSERQHRALIKGLEEELASTESNLNEMNEAIAQLRDAVQSTASAAEDVYAHIGCAGVGKDAADDLEKCTEANLKQYIGAIEERATHILIAYQRHYQSSNFLRVAATSSSSRAITETQSTKETVQNLEEEENALTANTTDSPQGEMLQTTDEWGVEEAEPIMQLAPQTAHRAVSAHTLVRMMELPSASLTGGAADRDNGYGDQDGDRIVSHEEIRKQMEARLAAMREREERNQRKKKDTGQRTK